MKLPGRCIIKRYLHPRSGWLFFKSLKHSLSQEVKRGLQSLWQPRKISACYDVVAGPDNGLGKAQALGRSRLPAKSKTRLQSSQSSLGESPTCQETCRAKPTPDTRKTCKGPTWSTIGFSGAWPHSRPHAFEIVVSYGRPLLAGRCVGLHICLGAETGRGRPIHKLEVSIHREVCVE